MRQIAWILCLTLTLPLAAADIAPPAPPLALHAAETENGIRLNWTSPPDVPDLDGFRIYRSQGGPFTAIAETTETHFLDPHGNFSAIPTESTAYYVTSFNSAGESPPSNMAATNYPHCWEVITSPGQLNLPVGVAIHCWLPITIVSCPDPNLGDLPVQLRNGLCLGN